MRNNKVESTNDSVLQEDLENIANSNLTWDKFVNKTVLITGATGLIGSLIVNSLLCRNRLHKSNIGVVAHVRNKEKAQSVFHDVLERAEFSFLYGDIREKINSNRKIDYIIHTASITASKNFVTKPVETIDTSIIGTRNILELAKEHNIDSMVYISSMEVYGVNNREILLVEENDLGFINPLSVRSSYSESKRMSECMCASFSEEFNISIKIARLAQTFGAGVSLDDARVFSQFIKSAISKQDIILHTKGLSFGNYCYTSDAIKAILLLLEKGAKGEAYNIVNENNCSTIKDMAKLVADKIAQGEIEVTLDIPDDSLKFGYAPDVKMKLSSKKMRSLGWTPVFDLEQMYLRLMKSYMERYYL